MYIYICIIYIYIYVYIYIYIHNHNHTHNDDDDDDDDYISAIAQQEFPKCFITIIMTINADESIGQVWKSLTKPLSSRVPEMPRDPELSRLVRGLWSNTTCQYVLNVVLDIVLYILYILIRSVRHSFIL